MCIVIDTNTLASVFKRDTANHDDFKPVLDWIYYGKGKVVYGGTKYLHELKDNYQKLFLQLRRAGKAIVIPTEAVDIEEIEVAKIVNHPDFDDQHLVGLLKVSQCKLICSLDARAYPFFRHSSFFSPAIKRPRIYSSKSNAGLLCDRNIAEICKPSHDTTNAQKILLGVK